MISKGTKEEKILKVSKNINFIAVMIVLSLVCLLNACGVNKETATSSTPTPASPSAVLGNAMSGSAASGAVVSEEIEKTEKEAKAKTVTVTDETGKKCTLKLDRSKIDFGDVGVIPSRCVVGNVVWNQVYKNDFYYACYWETKDVLGEGYNDTYTIYKNHGELVGTFTLSKQKFGTSFYQRSLYLCVYNNRFYFIADDINVVEGGREINKKMGYINLNEKEPVTMYNFSFPLDNFKGEHFYALNMFDEYMEYIFFQDRIFYEGKDRDFTDSLVSISMNQKTRKEVITKAETLQSDSNWFLMDGKIYFAKKKGKTVSLYSYDLQTNTKTKILKYNCNKELKGYALVEIDEQYIYSQDFIIPLKGGKMVRKDLQDYPFVHNDKYIFYIDSKYKLHRVDKDNLQRDKIISKKKFWGVYCTNNELYLKKYYKDLEDYLKEEDSDSFPKSFRVGIYVMDFDGKEIASNFYGGEDEE